MAAEEGRCQKQSILFNLILPTSRSRYWFRFRERRETMSEIWTWN